MNGGGNGNWWKGTEEGRREGEGKGARKGGCREEDEGIDGEEGNEDEGGRE